MVSVWRLVVRALDDAAFGPTLRRLFDFTIRFEEILFGITPAAILLAIAPLFLARHRRRRRRGAGAAVGADCHLWAKLSISFAVTSFEIATAVLRITSNDMLSTTIPAHLLACVAALVISVMLYYDHRYAIQSSAFLSIYFGATLLLDIAKARSFFLRSGARPRKIGALLIVISALKLGLVGLAEIPKRYRVHTKKGLGKEAISGFWNRTLFIWLNSTFFFGFGNRLLVDDLPNLAPGFYSEHLSSKFRPNWTRYEGSSHRLMKATSRSLVWSLLVPIPSRLLHVGFSISQPYVIQRILQYVGDDKSSDKTKALVGAYVLSSVGVTLSLVWFQHLNNRLTSRVRGMLVSAIFRKNIMLRYKDAKDGGAYTLMSTDVDGVMSGVSQLHDTWACVVEIGTSIYLTSTIAGKAAFVAVAPAILSAIISAVISSQSGPATEAWNGATELRVSKTSSVLSQIRSIKMIGIEPAVSELLQNLRQAEVLCSKKARSLHVALYAATPIAFAFTPIAVIACCTFWTGFKNGLEATSTFTVLAFLSLVVNPIFTLLGSWPTIGGLFACFKRIENFLTLEESFDTRNGRRSSHHCDEISVQGVEIAAISEKRHFEKYPVQFSKASLAPAGSQDGILQVDIWIERGTLTTVVGPTGCGKSTLLKAVIGEANIVKGAVYVQHEKVAYCGEIVWLRNISARDIIIGENGLDKQLYEDVVFACMLGDLDEFPEKDLTPVGSDGRNLSGGQKQRLALARAIYLRFEVLVMEDMLSAVDRESTIVIFERLFGPEGLLKKLGTTVIMATHTTEHLEMADAVLVIKEDGSTAMKCKDRDISAYMNKNRVTRDMTGVSDGGTNDNSAARHYKPEPAKQRASAELRPQVDWALYSFYLKSMSARMFVIFLLVTAMGSAMERLPDIFIRIWIEKAPTNKSWFIGYALLGVACVIGTAAFTWMYLICIVPGSSERLHWILLDTVMSPTFSFSSYTDTGDILARFSQDMSLLSRQLPMALMLFIYSLCLVMTELGIIFAGTTWAFAMLPIAALALFFLQLYYLRTSKQMRVLDIEAKAPLYTILTEVSEGVEHIRAFGWQSNYYKKAMALLDHSQKPHYYMMCIQQWLLLVLGLGTVVLSASLVTFALTFSSTSQQSLGLALLVAMQVSPVLADLVKNWINLENSLGAIERLMRFINEAPLKPTDEDEMEDAKALPENWPHRGDINLVDVSSSYTTADGNHRALCNVSTSIRGGTKVGIFGHTGSGKSSLLLTLLNFLTYTGEIVVDGHEISRIPRHVLRSRITTIAQDLMSLPCSVRDNVVPWEMGKPTAERINDTVIVAALGRVGLNEHILARGGLDASIEDVDFSNGQRQLLALARAIVHNGQTKAKLVLVDEATSGTDAACEETMMEVITEEFKDCTILNIAHRPSAKDWADTTLELSDGHLLNDE